MRAPSLSAARRLLALLGVAGLALAPLLLLRPPAPAPPPADPARLLPHAYWAHRRAHPARYRQPSCSAFPERAALQLAGAGASWQRLALRAGRLLLYAAHWDERAAPALVRVLVYSDVAPLPNLTCLLWFEDRNAPEAVPATATYGWREGWGGGPTAGVDEPYVLACAAPPGPAPRALSLAAAPCARPRNALAVQGAPPARPALATPPAPPATSVAACIKWLEYAEDASADLAEWIELLRALGADKLYVYVLQVHPNMWRVLQQYAARGFVELTPLELPPRPPGAPPPAGYAAMRRELLPLNDCLYRALRRHAWLALLDMDELIVPLRDATWPELIARESRDLRGASDSTDALVFHNYYFLRGAQRERAAPPPARMLAHVWRARLPSPPGHFVKSFHNVSSVVAVHNHTPVACGARACRLRYVAADAGRLQHYRARCGGGAAQCAELEGGGVVRDAALWARRERAARAALAAAARLLADLRIPLAPSD